MPKSKHWKQIKGCRSPITCSSFTQANWSIQTETFTSHSSMTRTCEIHIEICTSHSLERNPIMEIFHTSFPTCHVNNEFWHCFYYAPITTDHVNNCESFFFFIFIWKIVSQDLIFPIFSLSTQIPTQHFGRHISLENNLLCTCITTMLPTKHLLLSSRKHKG